MGCPCSRQTVQQTIRGLISKPRRPTTSCVACSPIDSRRAARKDGPGDIAIARATSRAGLTKLSGLGRDDAEHGMQCKPWPALQSKLVGQHSIK